MRIVPQPGADAECDEADQEVANVISDLEELMEDARKKLKLS